MLTPVQIDLSDGQQKNAIDPRLKDKVFSDPALEDVFYGQLLRMFDINHDGEISLEEFVMGLSSLSSGTRAEKAARKLQTAVKVPVSTCIDKHYMQYTLP